MFDRTSNSISLQQFLKSQLNFAWDLFESIYLQLALQCKETNRNNDFDLPINTYEIMINSVSFRLLTNFAYTIKQWRSRRMFNMPCLATQTIAMDQSTIYWGNYAHYSILLDQSNNDLPSEMELTNTAHECKQTLSWYQNGIKGRNCSISPLISIEIKNDVLMVYSEEVDGGWITKAADPTYMLIKNGDIISPMPTSEAFDYYLMYGFNQQTL